MLLATNTTDDATCREEDGARAPGHDIGNGGPTPPSTHQPPSDGKMMQRKNKKPPTDTSAAAFSPPSSPSPSKPSLKHSSTASKPAGLKHARSKPETGHRVATVKRALCGTSPFDRHWLNLDCCGIICATMTYCLHAYGVYAFGWVLLPPWFSTMDEDGYREVRTFKAVSSFKF